MDQIFEHPVFDSAREMMKRFIRQLEKSQEALKNSLYTCFSCGSNNVFSLQNRSDLLMKERLYSMSVVIVTINGGMHDTHNGAESQSKIRRWVYPNRYTNHIDYIRHFRI